jgi:hypothetical protein
MSEAENKSKATKISTDSIGIPRIELTKETKLQIKSMCNESFILLLSSPVLSPLSSLLSLR